MTILPSDPRHDAVSLRSSVIRKKTLDPVWNQRFVFWIDKPKEHDDWRSELSVVVSVRCGFVRLRSVAPSHAGTSLSDVCSCAVQRLRSPEQGRSGNMVLVPQTLVR